MAWPGLRKLTKEAMLLSNVSPTPNAVNLRQAWYKAFERVRLPDKPIGEINVLYSVSKP